MVFFNTTINYKVGCFPCPVVGGESAILFLHDVKLFSIVRKLKAWKFSCQIIIRGDKVTLNVLFIMSSLMMIMVNTTSFFSFRGSLKMAKTISSSLVWLLGPASSTLLSMKLPCGLEVCLSSSITAQKRGRSLGKVPGSTWLNYWRFGVGPISLREPEMILWNRSPSIMQNGRAC